MPSHGEEVRLVAGRDYTITSSQLASGRQSRSRPKFRPGPTFLDGAGPQPNWGTAHATRRCDLRPRPWLGCGGRPGPERYRPAVSRSISSTPSFEDASNLRRACSPARKPAVSPGSGPHGPRDEPSPGPAPVGRSRVHVRAVQGAGPWHCRTNTPTSPVVRHRGGTWCFRVRPGPPARRAAIQGHILARPQQGCVVIGRGPALDSARLGG